MPFNTKKCKVIHLGHSNQRNDYKLGDQILVGESQEKDLGIIIEASAKFGTHINATIKRANQKLGLLSRTFSLRDPTMMTKLYTRYVLPIINYGSPVWNPVNKGHCNDLEKVQKRFVRMVLGKGEYESKLGELGLARLEDVRLGVDLKLMHAIYKGESMLKFEDLFQESTNPKDTRGQAQKHLPFPKTHSNIRRHSFSIRCICEWNKLPLVIRDSSSELFKKFVSDIGF